jgi:hypothetical protein
MEIIVSIVLGGCSFLLGWVMCSGLYFFRTTRLTMSILKMSYVFYLTIMNKGLEYLHYAHTNRLEALRKNDKSYGHEEYESLKKDNDKQIETYKDNAITYLLQAHPDSFKQALEFDDWKGSQRFLNNNKYAAIIFSKENGK